MKYVKLSLPRVHHAIPRPRLFAWLDAQRREHPVIWICSPPGAGKTTLISSYLANADPPPIWYQVDKDDADPATWFFYLTQALTDNGPPLPLLTPELERDLPRFARRFFREFYARLAPGSVLVFDNLDVFDWPGAGDLIEIAFSEMPNELNIFALSREAPPARLSRLVMSGTLASLGWDELRFTTAEAHALAGNDDPADSQSQNWLEQVQGWAVGVMLLRDHRIKQTAVSGKLPMDDERDSAFRYFTGEILDRRAPAAQECLLMLSFLPGMSAEEAEQLTGDAGAPRLLRQLYQDRFFADRRGTDQPTYHFHPLFRAFLEIEARLRLGKEQRAALLQRAAAILDHRGTIDMAAQMYRDAGAFSSLARLLLQRANDMLVAGRGDLWREWLAWLPPAMLEADPWLSYWQGTSLNYHDPHLGKQALLRAEQSFSSLGDVQARLIAIAAIVDSYYFGLNDLPGLPHWIEAINEGLAQLGPNALAPDLELQIQSRLTAALMLATPESPALALSAQKTVQALAHVSDPSKRLVAGAILLHCMDWLEADTTRWLVAELGHYVHDVSISPFNRAWWCIRAALWHVYLDGNLALAQQVNESGLQLITDLNLDRLLFQLKYNKALILLSLGEPEAALPLLVQLKPLIPPTQKVDLARFSTLETNYSLQIGDTQKAIRCASEAIAQALQSDAPAVDVPRFYRFVACCYAQATEFALADEWYGKAIAHTCAPSGNDIADSMEARALVRAYAHARDGDQAAAPLLQAALSAHRQRGRPAFFLRFPQLAAAIAAVALDADIEKDHVRGIIKRQRLTAPGPFSANWPWPVAVRTLGSLSLSLNGDLLAFSGKAQQRPLVLLKALLLAPESGQTQQVIADHLWPDVADARASLNVTIHRLRKLLGNDDAVIVAGGKLSINRALVWSDVDALTDLCDRIQTLPAETAASELNQLALTLLSLYRGPFSDGSDESWLLSGRNRWRNRFLEGTTALGMRLEKLGELPMANTLYLRSLEVEPLAETMYRNLMRCAHAQNDPSAAFSAYRRCRETLSVILGKRPSPETEKLATSIGLIEPSG